MHIDILLFCPLLLLVKLDSVGIFEKSRSFDCYVFADNPGDKKNLQWY